MAGTATTTITLVERTFRKYSVAWTSSGGGAVSGNGFTVHGGYLHSLKLVPGSGLTVPTDQYDVTLVDADGIDLLSGTGANQSNTAGKIIQFDPPLFIPAGTLDLQVAAAGDSKTGRAELLVL